MGIGAGAGAAAGAGGGGAGRQVRGRPVRLVRRRRRGLGRHHRRRQVPPRRLCVPPPGADPFDGRPPQELHPRRPGDRQRQPLRPLALGCAARGRDHPGARHLVARAPRRASSSASASIDFGGGFAPFLAAARHRRRPARVRRRLPGADAGDRRPPALRPRGRRKWCSLDRRLLVGAAGADDHPRRRLRRRRRRSAASCSAAAGCAARSSASIWRHRRRLRDPLRRNAARRRPRRPDRVPLRDRPDRRRVARYPDAALPGSRSLRRSRSRPPPTATARTASATASSTSPATRLRRRPHPADRQQRRRRTRARSTIAGGEGWRRVNDFDLSWVNPDQGAGEPDRRRRLAAHRRRAVSTAAPSSPPARERTGARRPPRSRSRHLPAGALAARRGR